MCFLPVGGKTVLGQGSETRRVGFRKQQAFPSRATTSPHRSFVQIRWRFLLQTDGMQAQVHVDEQSGHRASAPVSHVGQVLLCSEQLLAPDAATPSGLLGAQSTNPTPPSCPFTLEKPGCSSLLPCLMSLAHVLSGAWLGSVNSWKRRCRGGGL